LWDLLERGNQFDEQDDVLWLRFFWWWELKLLFASSLKTKPYGPKIYLNEAHSGNMIGPESMVVSEILQGQRLTAWLPLDARSALGPTTTDG
jgi:hypothetical protein